MSLGNVRLIAVLLSRKSTIEDAHTVAGGLHKLGEGRGAIVQGAICVEEVLGGGDIGGVPGTRIFGRCIYNLTDEQGILVLRARAGCEKRCVGRAVIVGLGLESVR